MKKTTIDTYVGIFILIGIACIGYLTIKLGKMEWIGQNQYSVFANFDSITGLKKAVKSKWRGFRSAILPTSHWI